MGEGVGHWAKDRRTTGHGGLRTGWWGGGGGGGDHWAKDMEPVAHIQVRYSPDLARLQRTISSPTSTPIRQYLSSYSRQIVIPENFPSFGQYIQKLVRSGRVDLRLEQYSLNDLHN